MPRKKPKVPAAKSDPASQARNIVNDIFIQLLDSSTQARLCYAMVEHAWSPGESKGIPISDRHVWAAIEELALHLYWFDPQVQALMNQHDVVQFVTQSIAIAACPYLAGRLPPLHLIRLIPQDKLSVTIEHGEPVIRGNYLEASGAERNRIRKGLATSKALRDGTAMPRDSGRPEGYRKGRKVSTMEVWRWWKEWQDTDEEPTLEDLAAWLKVKSRSTAESRLKEVGQTWPPTKPKRARP